MVIQRELSQDIDPNQRWEITELGRKALRDATPTQAQGETMPIIHLHVGGERTACGSPIEAGDPELTRDLARVDCWVCLFALVVQGDPSAAYCDGGCPDCNEQPPAYLHGYADGEGKAHSEIRYRTADHDPKVCGCEPCLTVRVVLARLDLWPQGLTAIGRPLHWFAERLASQQEVK